MTTRTRALLAGTLLLLMALLTGLYLWWGNFAAAGWAVAFWCAVVLLRHEREETERLEEILAATYRELQRARSNLT